MIIMARTGYFSKRTKVIHEREGEYKVIEVILPDREAPPVAEGEEFEVIGKSMPRIEALEKVTGKAEYTTDVRLPGMLFGRLLRSSVARATITGVDISKAQNMRGVKAAAVFNSERVNYQGEIIAGVAAETPDIADDAVKAIAVTYQELPHLVNMDRSMQKNAEQIHENGNIGRTRENERGNVEQGFRRAEMIIEATYTTQVEFHNPLEPHGSVVHWKDNEILIYSSTQTVSETPEEIMEFIRREFPDVTITEKDIRVICNHMGGGFGSKLGVNNLVYPALRLSRMTNAPVRMILDRYEESLDTGNRPNSRQNYKIGVRNDGTITAIELEGFTSGGFTRGGDRLSSAASEMYKCANLKAKSSSVYTNTGSGMPTRAPGHVQAFFGFESLIDEAAEAVGIDPLEFRRKNFTDRSGGGTGLPYSSNGLLQCYKIGAEKIGWSRRRKTPGSSPGVLKRGLGMGSLQWGAGGHPGSVVLAEIFKDGAVNVRCGTQDVGTGTRTVMAQVAAEELGVGVSDVTIQIGDSSFPPGEGSGGSNTAASVCPAVRNGVVEALKKLYPVVAGRLGVEPDDLESEKGKIYVKENQSAGMTYKEAAVLMPENKVVGEGRRGENPKEYAGNTFGVNFCEVEVDIETGRIKVIKVVAVHESGRIINPLTARNQVVGGVNQALSYALLEERIMDNYTGRLANPNLHDYKVVTSRDAPEIDVTFVDIVDPYRNNLGMKGLGEPTRVGFAAAFSNAVYNATGVRTRDLPITPDKILSGLAAGKEGRS